MQERHDLGGNGVRTVTMNWQTPNAGGYPSNKISTTRYSWYSIFPISLLIQFTKVSNTFYAIGAILQSIPAISTNDPLATIIPLAYVIAVGMLKEFLADYKRYKMDKQTNRRPVTLLTREPHSPAFVTREVRTEQLQVGDVV